MASVQSKDTAPELLVRKALHRRGYRYRLHRRDLPGSPDIVFPSRRKAIFVNGCFWHGHRCKWGNLPKSRLDYWAPKIAANKKRDARNLRELAMLDWATKVIWQCELREWEKVIESLVKFLEDS